MATNNPVHEYLSVTELDETRNNTKPPVVVEWRTITHPRITAGYEVSNTGLVTRTDTGKILKVRLTGPTGYLAVSLKGTNVSGVTSARVDKLVLEAFTGPQPEGLIPLHADGDQANCALDNLSWGTPPEGEPVRTYHPPKKARKKRKAAAPRSYSDQMQIDRRYRLRGITAIVHEDFSVELTIAGSRNPVNLSAENFAALARVCAQIEEMNKLVGGAR